MVMQMQRAFNAKFLIDLTRRHTTLGSYDDDNDWVEGTVTNSPMKGRMVAGNKFSQFEEGLSIHHEDGGVRIRDYRSLYITDRYELSIGDKVIYKGVIYNVLQESDEAPFGFKSFLLEKSDELNT